MASRENKVGPDEVKHEVRKYAPCAYAQDIGVATHEPLHRIAADFFYLLW